MTISHPHRGFTLIEAAIVLTIVTILAAIAAPGMQQLIAERRLDNAAVSLAGDLCFVRSAAVARNQTLR